MLGWPTHGAKSWRSRSSNVISCPIVSMGPCLTGGRDVRSYFHFRGSKLAHQMSLNVKSHDSPWFAGQMWTLVSTCTLAYEQAFRQYEQFSLLWLGNCYSKVKGICEIRASVVMSRPISVSLSNHGPISHRQENICDFHIRDLQINLWRSTKVKGQWSLRILNVRGQVMFYSNHRSILHRLAAAHLSQRDKISTWLVHALSGTRR